MSAGVRPVLQVERLVAGYGEQRVLEDVSLAVERGEILVVLGGSGSGKSTLLRCVVGLLAPWGGRVLVGGRDVNAARGRERDSATSAWRSRRGPAQLHDGGRERRPARREHWGWTSGGAHAGPHAAAAGLGGAGTRCGELSGGMRKRGAPAPWPRPSLCSA
jgi:ABC-type transporter Mla maintaining outer membrane lipid asymmetry ATPase subunit MlaF